MKISIAMATFNGAAFVREQLESFAQQSRLPDELVVTDDLSTDDTVAIVDAFAMTAEFPVRREVNRARVGLMRNFERALSLCTGDLVLPSDQDDVWLPGKLASMEAAAQAYPERACLITDALLTDALLQPTGTTKMGQIRAAGLPPSAMVMGCCTAFRSDLLRLLLPIPSTQRAHDNWLVQMSDLLELTLRLEQPLQFYRRHGGNASDFFVNRLQVPGFRRRLRERFEDLVRRLCSPGGLDDERQFFLAAAERLQGSRAGAIAVAGTASVDAALAVAATRATHLQRRHAIRALPRARRAAPAWRLWRDGGYRGARLAGIIKDLVITRAEVLR